MALTKKQQEAVEKYRKTLTAKQKKEYDKLPDNIQYACTITKH